ncbi:MAG: 23S rRNA (adenine(2030)-N(6))-methyltransferase RlmJ [Gammaproteobacteria bacterium]|nr:23S rRNA (adenine(2030)-N(6))-methyltransferase RlmJ [Gammaproteobacteria bacterium]
MNYRHSYHAGNFADVFKHVILTLLLQALRAKDKPFCYFDSHAGAGRYDLLGEAAQKTGEYREGIARFWEGPPAPPEMADYLAAVRAVNEGGGLRCYPGSPRIARHLLRAQDRMVLMELHPEEAHALRREFRGDPQVRVHHMDGFSALKAFLPPQERRGLVLIDPPFERADEFDHMAGALQAAHARWSTGIYAIWYPLKDPHEIRRFHRQLAASGLRKLLLAEISFDAVPGQLYGCGMVILNPPWKLDEQLNRLLPALLARFQFARGVAKVEWLAPE